ncbi:MAG: hypothetical protein HRU20_30025, partial [Pseudomonadales bacterium]|nr:hypothetical protein [Pseudomonadales bacterium]
MINRFKPFLFVSLLTYSLAGLASSQLQQDINELKQTLQEKTESRESFEKNLQAGNIKTRELRSDILSLEIEIKQLNREERKIQSLSGPTFTETQQSTLHKVSYKRKVAQIALNKKHVELDALDQEQNSSANRVSRLTKLIAHMETEVIELKRSYKAVAVEQARQVKRAKAQEQATARQKKKEK